ncbi:hypothetical protein ACFWN2_16020 [Lentzea sp. NPDC058436]|uniref:hypothetical protein n=1 Tax=Lentzea sp. NPDC058436 TaxID=3346499 RepID=UPI003654CD8D
MARTGAAPLMLVSWIHEVAGEPLLLDGDPIAQSRENTWMLGLAEGESPSAGDVVAAFQETARLLGERVSAMGRTATFYVWHDERSGHLRCSTTSSSRDALPFGARVDSSAALDSVVGGFLRDPGGVVLWQDLREPEDAEEQEHVVRVWAVELG